jgi:hypothetical protein
MGTQATLVKELDASELNVAPPPPGRIAQAKVANNRRVFNAAGNSAEFFDHLRAHYRETRRTVVDIDCNLQVVLSDGTLFDAGSAVVRDMSPSGALLVNLRLPKGSLPIKPFKLVIGLRGVEYNGIAIEATPVRIAADCGGLGVRFDDIVVSV